MRFEKRQVLKADGRRLVYYHFPETATPEETHAFGELTDEEPAPAVQAVPEPPKPRAEG